MADPWDKELTKPKTPFLPATPATPTAPVLLDERSNTGGPDNAKKTTPETSSSTRQRLDRFPGVGEGEKANSRFPDVGFDVIVQDDDVLNQGDRDAGPKGIIRNVQGKLNALGLDVGDVDGVIGRKTSRAIQEAQGKLGLPRTGLLDRKTRLGLTTLSPSQLEFFKNNPESEAGYQYLGENVPVTAETAKRRENLIKLQNDNQDQYLDAAYRQGSDTTFATIISGDSSTEVTKTPPLTAGFDSLVEAEGTNIHLDGRGFVTLPYGIVPDKDSVTKADGTAFNPTGSHGLKTSDLSGVDYSNATKFGVSRTSYDTDEDFAKAVYSAFASKTVTKYGEGFDNLTDEAKQAAYDLAWNAGIGSASWSSVQTMLQEASKEDDNTKTTDNLIGFTSNFRSGKEKVNGVIVNNYPRGLLKRRLTTYNLVAKAGEEAAKITTKAVMENKKRTGTQYEIKTSDGSVLKTWTKTDLNELLGDLAVE